MKNYIRNKISVDLDQQQNLDLIKNISTNTLFYLSPKDDIITKKQFDALTEEWGTMGNKKGWKEIVEHQSTHAGMRTIKSLKDTMTFLLSKDLKMGNILFSHHFEME